MCVYKDVDQPTYGTGTEIMQNLICYATLVITNLTSMCTDYSDDERGGMAAAPIDGDCGFDAMETHFEGIFQAGGHQVEGGGAWGSTDPYQGVEPMG